MLHLLLLLPATLAQLQLAADVELSLRSPMVDSFTCDGRAYGYYADQGNNCQLFHICMPVQVGRIRPYTGIIAHWCFCKAKTSPKKNFWYLGEIGGIEKKGSTTQYLYLPNLDLTFMISVSIFSYS